MKCGENMKKISEVNRYDVLKVLIYGLMIVVISALAVYAILVMRIDFPSRLLPARNCTIIAENIERLIPI